MILRAQLRRGFLSLTTCLVVCSGFLLSSAVDLPTALAAGGSPSFHNLHVGPGFTDSAPHQLVRTSDDRLWVIVPDCSGFPKCAGGRLHAYRATSTNVVTSFTEEDAAHAPAGSGSNGIVSSAVVVDSSNVIHVLYNNPNNPGTVSIVAFNTSSNTWGTPTVLDRATGFDQSNYSPGQGDEGVALALDQTGALHAAWSYVDGNDNRHIRYSNNASGAWSAPTPVDDVAAAGGHSNIHPTLTFGPDRSLYLLYLNGSSNGADDGTVFIRKRSSAGSWGSSVLVGGPQQARTSIDDGLSEMVTRDGVIHVAFISQPNDYLRYYYSTNGGDSWIANHPGGGTQSTHDPSLGPGSTPNSVRIYSHGTPNPIPDGTGVNLYYFQQGSGGNAAWSSWKLYTAGAYDCSVSTRWQQFVQTDPNSLDVAYWSSAYPNQLYVGWSFASTS